MVIKPVMNTTTIADKQSQGRMERKRMWPSFETATRLQDAANMFGIGALVIGVIAAALVFWMGNVKEEYLRRELSETNARAEEAKAGVAIATENAAKANERAASLERDAAHAKLETERLKAQLAWRMLPQNLENSLKNTLSKHVGKINIQHVANDTEAQYFAIQLANIFGSAGWEVGLSSVSMSGVAIFGIWVPDTNSPSTQTVRNALIAIGIGFSTQALPVGGAGFSSGSTLTDAPILFIGSKPIKQ